MQGLQLCTDWKLVATGELSLGLRQSGAESMCQKVVRGWPLSKQDRSPQGPRKSPQQQRVRTPGQEVGQRWAEDREKFRGALCSHSA